MNHFNIPFAMPLRFVKNTLTPGIHFDDSWACEQIRSFERRVFYKQKWETADSTLLQIESSIQPMDLELRNRYNLVVRTYPWTEIVTAAGYSIYETTFETAGLPSDTYYAYQRVTLLGIDWQTITEPILVWPKHINTLPFTYRNSYNKDDVGWTTGITCQFRCEADIQDYEPLNDKNDFVNMMTDTVILDSKPSDLFQLYIGDAPGVAPYVLKILNYIFSCDYVNIAGKQYTNQSGSKFKITRTRGYPLIGASLDLVPSLTESSIQFRDNSPLLDGLVTAYNIKTGFFGPAAEVPIIEVIQRS